MTPAETQLRRFAAAVGVRIRPCNVLNPNAGEVAHVQAKLWRRDRRVVLFAGERLIQIEVKLAEGRLAFAIGEPDRVCLLNQPLDRPDFPWPVYVDDVNAADPICTWLDAAGGVEAINAVGLASGESLTVYRNAVCCLVGPERAIAELLDCVLAVAESLPHETTPNSPLDIASLPEAFRDLVQFFDRWAIADDAERQERIDRATARQRRILRAAVEPKLSHIRRFLNSLSDPVPESALQLGYLAELVAELCAREA